MTEKELMMSPDKWPLGNLLPLKRHIPTSPWPMIGCLCSEGGTVEPIVYSVPHAELEKRATPIITRRNEDGTSFLELEATPNHDPIERTEMARYESIDELIAVGWEVD